MSIAIKSNTKCFGGQLVRIAHESTETKTEMTCAVFVPHSTGKVPCILYLSGLTCTDENVCQKGGPFRTLAELGIAFIAPTTSPAKVGIPGEADSYDFGYGAGFYLDATAAPWAENYRMYSYITSELPVVLAAHFPTLDLSRISITGHSMGGHGALTIAAKNPIVYKSVSAFSPVCNPINCPWGNKAFSRYLSREDLWKQYDASELFAALPQPIYPDILIDIGTDDNFLKAGQLLPEALLSSCEKIQQPLTLRMQDGYDHSYYFVSTFMEDHIRFHAKYLLA